MPLPDDFSLDTLALDFEKGAGRVMVVTQDAVSGAVLMVAHADREALDRTVASGEMHYLSRTRGLWHKGATSGNTQRVESLVRDCDGDAVLARVLPAGPACHTGARSCFGNGVADALGDLGAVIAQRAGEAPDRSYTAALLGDRNRRLKKLGEEAAELIAACADGDAARATEEAADLVYHVAVALQAAGSSLERVRETLAARRRAGN
jgi:phosphoribosyl-AMP cyclohydrolase / phosphoribosyl-ATP pyrophosphohydrolase